MKKSKQSARNRALAGMLRPAHIAPVAIEDPHVETAADFKREFNAQEAAKEAAKAEQARIARGRTILTQASPEMEDAPKFNREGSTPERFLAAARVAFGQFQAGLTDVTLNEGAQKKLGTFAALHPLADWTLVATWNKAYSLLREYSFDNVDVTDLSSEPEAQLAPVAPSQKFDDLDTQLAREAVLSACQGEARVWFDAFAASLQRNFNYILSDAEVAAVIKVMERGLQFNRAADWDRARLICVRNGSLASHLKYPAELLNEKLEDANLDDFETKQAYRREFYKLQS